MKKEICFDFFFDFFFSKEALTFNTVFCLTLLELCCQVALNLQSCHALEFSGSACLENTTEQNLVLCYWKDVCFLLVSAGDRSFYGPGANRVITARNPDDTVMNEPAGWGKQNHVLEQDALEQDGVW